MFFMYVIENHDVNMLSNRYGQDRVWKYLKVNNKDHMICFTKENESWKVLLTNLIEIWTETLTDETILRKCQVFELFQIPYTYILCIQIKIFLSFEKCEL